MIKKLNTMPYAQARVEISPDNKSIFLRSYKTTVISLIDDWLTVHGLYSMTTRKHISAFMHEYTCLRYSDAKKAFEDKYSLNIETGEIRFLNTRNN